MDNNIVSPLPLLWEMWLNEFQPRWKRPFVRPFALPGPRCKVGHSGLAPHIGCAIPGHPCHLPRSWQEGCLLTPKTPRPPSIWPLHSQVISNTQDARPHPNWRCVNDFQWLSKLTFSSRNAGLFNRYTLRKPRLVRARMAIMHNRNMLMLCFKHMQVEASVTLR